MWSQWGGGGFEARYVPCVLVRGSISETDWSLHGGNEGGGEEPAAGRWRRRAWRWRRGSGGDGGGGLGGGGEGDGGGGLGGGGLGGGGEGDGGGGLGGGGLGGGGEGGGDGEGGGGLGGGGEGEGGGGLGGGDVLHSRIPTPRSQSPPLPAFEQQCWSPPPHGPRLVNEHIIGSKSGQIHRPPRPRQQSPGLPKQLREMTNRVPSWHTISSLEPDVVISDRLVAGPQGHESSGNAGG